jgi:acetyl esterase/lipase
MDVYLPSGFVGLRPAALYVHGGGFTSGGKEDAQITQNSLIVEELLLRGYVVVSVNYRLAAKYQFPSSIEDVKCAVRSLRANAEKYNIDPARIGAWGDSAGGTLVSLLGVADESAGFDVGEFLDHSSRVQAVADFFGPGDWTADTKWKSWVGTVFPTAESLVTASPVTYISKDDPPFLIVQGENDSLVYPSQSKEFFARLVDSNVSTTLIMVKNAGHDLVPVGDGELDPSIAEIVQNLAAFFDEHVRENPAPMTVPPTQRPPPTPDLLWVLPVGSLAAIAVGVVLVIHRRRRSTKPR